jgi:cell division protease FtsH
MLAGAARPIAEVLVDSLRASLKERIQNPRGRSAGDADRAQFDLWVADEPNSDTADDGTDAILRPDEAAVAVLLGQALDRQRDALARLQDPDTVTIIEVPAAEFVNLIESLLHNHVLGPGAPLLDGRSLEKQPAIATAGSVAIFRPKKEDKANKASGDNAELAAAVQQRCAVLGIAVDPDRELPRDLVRMAENRIVVKPLDASAIAAVIEAVTGRRPSAIDDAPARRASLSTLNVAVRGDLGAERSLARLRRLLDASDQVARNGPLLSEMHGMGAAKQFGLDLVADLRAYLAGAIPASALPRGLILSGPPGTGKTSFARALAREAGVHFISTSYSAWQSHKEGHLGHVTQAIRATFAEARRNSPCIVFIDEIDSLPARGRTARDNDWWTAIVNCLIECLDGFAQREAVAVIAATNADPSKAVDPALLRAGRLDHHIAIPLPDVPALMGIFRSHLGADLAGADLRAAALAARGHTGADVERWVRQARRSARTANRALDLADLLDAVRDGKPDLPVDLQRLVATHESGHAVALLALGIAQPKALSIGGGGGFAESDIGELKAQTRSYIEKFLAVLLAGRAAEQLVFGEVTAGAGGGEASDLARVTQLATSLETTYGLGSLGLLCLPGGATQRDLLLLDELRAAVGRTVDRAYTTALDLLRRQRPTLDALATALFAAGYLDRGEIDAVLARCPLRMNKTTAPAPADDTRPTAPSPKPDDAAVTITEPPPYPAIIVEP